MRCLPIRLFFAAFYFVALFFFACFFVVTFFITNQTSFSLFFWTVFFPAIFFGFFYMAVFFAWLFLLFLDGTFFSHESDGLLFVYCFWTGLFFRTNQTFWRRLFGLFPNAIFFRWHLLFSHEFFFCCTDNGNILNFLSSRDRERWRF